jgi:hypothetical protein
MGLPHVISMQDRTYVRPTNVAAPLNERHVRWAYKRINIWLIRKLMV